MKRNLLLTALLLATFNSYATGNEGNGCIGNCPTTTGGGTTTSSATSSATATAGALALSGAAAFGGGGYANSGNNSINVQGDSHDRTIPVSSAIAPNLTTSVICPITSPTSHAVQFLVFGGSTTGNVTLNGICVAYHLGQTAVVERMACNADAAYRKANPACEVK